MRGRQTWMQRSVQQRRTRLLWNRMMPSLAVTKFFCYPKRDRDDWKEIEPASRQLLVL